MFQTLGMVIHHLQDMSQPQHVRNDAHCNAPACLFIPFQWDPSWYENYTNIHRQTILDQYHCDDYPTLDLSRFPRARYFWNNPMHYGQVEYTNRNFVSKDTNFRWLPNSLLHSHVAADRQFALPDPQNGGAGLDVESIDICDASLEKYVGPNFPLCGEMQFYGTWVSDNYQGKISKNKRTSSFSLWTDKLDEYLPDQTGIEEVEQMFNLNSINFHAAYDYLMPRAIAYSAGLINYFFRGRMQVSRVVYVPGSSVTLTVTNTTAEENPGNAAFAFSDFASGDPGRFYLYQDESDGTRWEIPAMNPADVELTGQQQLAANQSMRLVFDLSSIPGGTPSFDLASL